MLRRGQTVIAVTGKGISYEANIVATAKSDHGLAAYKVVTRGTASKQLVQ